MDVGAGLMYDKFTFAISSPDEFLLMNWHNFTLSSCNALQ